MGKIHKALTIDGETAQMLWHSLNCANGLPFSEYIEKYTSMTGSEKLQTYQERYRFWNALDDIIGTPKNYTDK